MLERPFPLDGHGLLLIPFDRKNRLATKMVRERGKVDAALSVALIFTVAWPADRAASLLVALAVTGLIMARWAWRNRRRRRALLALAETPPRPAEAGDPHA